MISYADNPQGDLKWDMTDGRVVRLDLGLALHLMSTCATEAEYRRCFYMDAEVLQQNPDRRPSVAREKRKAKAKAAGAA